MIRLSHLGDIILTEPIVRSIKLAHPNAVVDYLTREEYREVVELFDGIDSIHTLKIPGRDKSLIGLSKTIKEMCSERYDLVVDLHNNLRSWWIKFQLNANKIVTYPKSWRARRRAVKKKLHTVGLHTVDLYLLALRGTRIPFAARDPELIVSEQMRNDAELLLADRDVGLGGYAVFALGASHPTKHYPIPQWVELADAVVSKFGMKIVIIEKDDWDYFNLFDDLAGSGKLSIITGQAIPILAGILAGARFTVSNDSGVMHLSAAVGTPTIGLFGPTHPVLGFAPLGERCRAVTTNENCSPCSKHGESLCHREERFCFTKMDSGMIMKHLTEVIDIE